MSNAPAISAADILRALRQLLEAQEKRISNLATREATLMQQVETLERRAVLAEANVDALETERQRLVERERELDALVAGLNLRVDDAERRAQLHEARSSELQPKADHHDRLETASNALLASLDALPLDMKDAALIPGAVRPKIGLYGTYDWQRVMDAKFALMNAVKREE